MGGMYEKVLETFDSATGFTVLGNDTVNLAMTDNRIRGLKALEFDKTNGAANTVHAGASRTVAFAIDEYAPFHRLCWYLYVSATTDVAYTWIRLGTDASNYAEWRFLDTSMVAGWNLCHVALGEPTATAGTACDCTTVIYMAFGVAFDAEDDALANMAIDRLSLVRAEFATS